MKLRQIRYGCLTMLVFLLLSSVFSVTAYAHEKIDTDQIMSLTVINQTDSVSIKGAEFQLYRVANVTENGIFQAEADFRDSNVSLSTDATEESWSARAVTLEAYLVEKAAENSPISPVSSATTDEKGVATFYNLHGGLYLLTGKQMTVGQTTYTPLATLISLTYLEEGNASRNYVPSVSVKNSTSPNYVPSVSIKNLTKPIRDKFINLSVIKIWKDTGYENQRPSKITVTLYRDGVEYSTVDLDVTNNWKYTWKDVESNARWHLVEKNISSNYTVTSVLDGKTFVVTNTYGKTLPDNPIIPTPTTSSQVETNTNDKKPSDNPITPSDNPIIPIPDTLPQTGQLWWPVSLLSVCGLALFLIGCGIRRKGSSRHEEK